MKLAVADRPIERIGTKAERHFSIKATGKAFRILSSGLYKEKILAIVRELSCNAYDAHVAAGRPKMPFDVHLPNSLEPYFAVRDYGPGLSPDDMETVYTTYFESTKTDSDEFIGALGLGSKSPLSYVDSFTATSYHGGWKRIYTVFFDEGDTPSIALMAEEETSEPTGLEVHIPVRSMNYGEFCSCAKRVYQYFDPVPRVEGNADFKVVQPTVVLSGPEYTLTEEHSAKAVMGIVAYPISVHSIPELSQLERELLSNGFVIRFPVGALEITAGREELGYDERTKAAIKARMGEIVEDLPMRILKMFRKCKTEFEARKLYSQIMARYSAIRSLFPSAGIPWKQTVIDSGVFALSLPKDFPTTTICEFNKDAHGDRTSIKFKSHIGHQMAANDRVKLEANDKLVVWYDDMNGRAFKGRIRMFRQANREAKCWLIKTDNPEEFEKLKATLDGVEFIPLSSLPKPPPNPRAPTSVLMLIDSERHYNKLGRSSWEKVDVEPGEGGCYVRMVGGVIHTDKGEKITMVDFTEVYDTANALGLDTSDELYGIPKSIASQYLEAEPDEESDGWYEYFAMIREAFLKKMIEEDWATQIAKMESLKAFQSSGLNVANEYHFLRSFVKRLPEDHRLHAFVDLWQTCQTTGDFSRHARLAAMLGIEFEPRPQVDLLAAWHETGTNYHMIKYLFQGYRWDRKEQDMMSDLYDYVMLTDAGRNCQIEAA